MDGTGQASTEGGHEGVDVAGLGGVGEGAKVGRHVLVVGGAAEGLGVLGHVVLLVPEAVAAAGNCHLRRGLFGISPASGRDGQQKGNPFGGGFGTLGHTRAFGSWRSGGAKKNLAAG